MDVLISDIVIGSRHRKDFGDIPALAASIEEIGLLHPIVLRPDKTLVVGQRRIEAYKILGREKIPVNTAANLLELTALLKAEVDENKCRKDFDPVEAVAVGADIEKAYKPVAEAAKAAAGGDKKSEAAKSLTETCRKRSRKETEAATVTAVAAAAVGMSRKTYEKAKAVVKSKNKKAIAAMKKTRKVNGSYKLVVTAKAAEAIKAEPPPLPTGPFRVLVVDPPWQYGGRAEDPSHRAANPYPTMTVDAIKAMPVCKLACPDSVLWLWTTNAFMRESYAIADAWGFTVKTILTWAKDRMGTGDWLRGQTEHCLMCVKGKPTIVLTNQTTLLNAPLRAHSQKPEEFYALVDALCPGSKCELFSRQARTGWEQHGNEV